VGGESDVARFVRERDEMALRVGRLVLAFTQLEFSAVGLITWVLGDTDETYVRYWGRGGVVDEGMRRTEEREPRAAGLGARLKGLRVERNHVVHGLWVGGGSTGTGQFVRPVLHKSPMPANLPIDDHVVPLSRLRQLEQETEDLDADVMRLWAELRSEAGRHG
jgi:hypothetical protein